MAVTAGMPVPVFAAVGAGAWGPVQELRARPDLRLVDTPRHAAVLLVAGRIPAAHRSALDRVHDQVPHPRAVVEWPGDAGEEAGAEVVGAIDRAFHDVTADPARTSPDRLPDEEPTEWRGVGPHGQGGEGMMGGTPYGRPMATTGDDRDGLALDQLRLRLGPFLTWLPPGVALDVTLQGEILQSVSPQLASPSRDDTGVLVDTAALEPGRAGLRWLAHALHVHGLDVLAVRAARLASAGGDRRDRFARLRRAVHRSGLLSSIRGVAPIEGLGDAAGRWRQMLAWTADSLAPGHPGRPPRARVTWDGLSPELTGMSLTDAVTTIVSLGDSLSVPDGELAGA